MYHASIISINIIWNPRKNTPLIPGATRCGLPILPENESSLYVTLLSFILALALTAALAACGSDEPSGGNGSDRTASTPTDTPAAPTRTLATPRAGTASTATDAPGPAAATAPPAASGSVETDREALVALYNATDGENWNRKRQLAERRSPQRMGGRYHPRLTGALHRVVLQRQTA